MDEEEAPEDPADDPAKNLSASIKIPSKTLCSQEETVNSDELERAKDSPWAPPKEKLKEHDANKGIKISENPPMPSMDDVSLTSVSFFSNCRTVAFLSNSPLIICTAADSP
jgi:hypothetical protein